MISALQKTEPGKAGGEYCGTGYKLLWCGHAYFYYKVTFGNELKEEDKVDTIYLIESVLHLKNSENKRSVIFMKIS